MLIKLRVTSIQVILVGFYSWGESGDKREKCGSQTRKEQLKLRKPKGGPRKSSGRL